MQALIRSHGLYDFGGTTIDEEGGRGKGLGPKRGRHVCLKEESTHGVVKGPNGTFGLTVLWGGVWARVVEVNDVPMKKIHRCGIDEFRTIVCLDRDKGQLKLRVDIANEIG